MVFAITVLRALAAVLITNAHYTGVYPVDLIANGGLLGDVLFFAVSGYCLYNIKLPFFKWYGKRIYRVYPPVIMITLIYILFGAYSLKDRSIIWWLVYPTNYHFVASIIILYIPYYFVMGVGRLRNRLPIVMMFIGILWICIYAFIYDKSYYHIDNVYEPIVRILFFEAMLLGAWFRKNDNKIRNKIRLIDFAGTVVFICIYFGSKLMLVRYESLSGLQFINQIAIFTALYFIIRAVLGIDGKLKKMPDWLKWVITLISEITLEIYVVQYVLIDMLRGVSVFPVNWLILTISILFSAYILHITCKLFYKICDRSYEKLKKG